MQRIFVVLCSILLLQANAQEETGLTLDVRVVNRQLPVADATVEVLRSDSSMARIQITDSSGRAIFQLPRHRYFLRISKTGFTTYQGEAAAVQTIDLQPAANLMETVTVAARKPFIELQHDKTVVNLDASVTNIGTTVLEALEKLPGVTVDRDGNISLKGRSGVLVLIDGKQTWLGSSELATLLGNMSSANVSQIELMTQPPARYEAAGNAGIINIKTKKNRQKGFNGTVNTSFGQGRYPKSNNSVQLNLRSGKANYFLNYSVNANRNYMEIYALRTYYGDDGVTPLSLLEQPSYLRFRMKGQTARLGADYTVSGRTTIGWVASGAALERRSFGNNRAEWMNPAHQTDSLIITVNNGANHWKNGGINLNLRHSLSAKSELTADVDALGYRIRGEQYFENTRSGSSGYTEASRGSIPTRISILSAKADFSTETAKKIKWQSGWKSSYISTNNLAAYDYRENGLWKEDLAKTNHFLYSENIHALYGSAGHSGKRWNLQGGLRYEFTAYEAKQLGNALQKDSSFSRNYHSLFPTASASWTADSSNSFSLSAGRRIDRPPFQKLNPFLFIINKYTYMQGNPYYRPQYTWNVEVAHLYRQLLVTSLNYSLTSDHFSQVFTVDSNGTIVYTEGNLGRLQVFGASISLQVAPASWWSLTAQATGNHKRIEGMVWKEFNVTVNQLTATMNNQFHWKKGWSGEVSGTYTTRSQHDVQEVVDPSGQLSAGVSKTILKGQGTLRLALRDILYTQAMAGNTYFRNAHEYFKLTRDSRTLTASFVLRFGKATKTAKRSSGAAGDEIQRVGNGN